MAPRLTLSVGVGVGREECWNEREWPEQGVSFDQDSIEINQSQHKSFSACEVIDCAD